MYVSQSSVVFIVMPHSSENCFPPLSLIAGPIVVKDKRRRTVSALLFIMMLSYTSVTVTIALILQQALSELTFALSDSGSCD